MASCETCLDEFVGDATFIVRIDAGAGVGPVTNVDIIARPFRPAVDTCPPGPGALNPCIDFTVQTIPEGDIFVFDGTTREVYTENAFGRTNWRSNITNNIPGTLLDFIDLNPCSCLCIEVNALGVTNPNTTVEIIRVRRTL